MTVAELIAELSKLDPQAKIAVDVVDYDCDHREMETDIVKVYVGYKGVVHIETTEKE